MIGLPASLPPHGGGQKNGNSDAGNRPPQPAPLCERRSAVSATACKAHGSLAVDLDAIHTTGLQVLVHPEEQTLDVTRYSHTYVAHPEQTNWILS